ncbi:telomeric repeat-binding factor 2-interacting protein 1-like [Mercenaria mercenaria]|uniref:telomeric repeat-binding factor 2-interacting protein 1-like n=1 Tax=Mercenaria mercenaria TaxID=6596 RepID=UPI00234F736C|nr:telomeric repeat-binding factor 2-interacting protein 1-like [Mercenaria mercenaria]
MAVENKFKHSKDLFQNADGSSMVFFMRPCNQRQELRPLIEYGGGKVTSKVLKDSTKLAEKGSMVSGDDYISAHFIEDCVKQNKLLPVDSYRVQPGTRVRSPSGDSDVSKYSFSSNDSMSPAGYIVQTSARDYKGRSKYTKEEDIAMITFLVEERRYSEALGIRVWKDMELRKITKHTASSMNTRYRKHILPNIESYKYDVDRRWLSKLTGGSVVKKTEPEFTADALFATYKKRSKRPDSTARKVNLTGGFGDMFDFTMSDEDNPKKTENVHEIKNINEKKENGDKVVEVGNKSLNKKSKDLKEDQMNSKKGKENQGKEINENQGDNKKGKEIIENKGDIKTGKDNKQNQGDSKKSKEMKGNKGDNQHDGAENSKNKTNSDELIHIGTNFEENNIKKADNEEPSREIATYEEICKDSSNREEQSGGKSNCEKCNQVETDCEKHCKEKVYRAYAVEVVLDKLTEKEINSEKGKFDHSLETLNEKEKLPAESKDKCDGIPGISRKSNDLFEQINKRSKGKDKNKLNSKLDIDNDKEDIEYLNAAPPSPSDIFQMTDEDSMELEENDKVDKNEEIKMIVKKMDDGRLTLSQRIM